VKAKEWTAAAKESNRKPPISAERNKYVKDLFEKAVVMLKNRSNHRAKNYYELPNPKF
jgi:hypothetical protein